MKSTMNGALKGQVFLLRTRSFCLFAAVLFVQVCVSSFADGFYAEQFRLTALGDPQIEMFPCRASIESLTEDILSEDRSEDPIGFDFSSSSLILGQSSDAYWTAVQTSPILVAQSTAGVSAADQAPTLSGAGSSAPQSTTSVAPPTDAGTLTPSSGNVAPPFPTDSNPNFFSQPVQTMKRFWEGTSAAYTFIPKSGNSGLGLHDFDFNIQFNFPCKYLPHANQDGVSGYWYLSPNFGMQFWDMPDLVNVHSMPGETFDASLGFGAKPQFSEEIGADLWVQVGVASSFKKVNSDAFFIRGRGLATLKINEQVTAIGGVVYYGRNRYKLLPSGGIRWIPNDKNDWYLVFPNPRLSHYLANLNETKWWGYLQGDIGGGRWLTRDFDGTYNLDYNDYRVGLGLQFECPSGFNGFFEVGGAFGRQLYAHSTSLYKPKSAVYLKAGFAF
jgi:hypothetical protein